MLFGGKKSKYPALIAVLTSVIMTIVSVLPFFYTNQLNLSVFAFFLILMLGIWFTLKSVKLYKSLDDISARNLMLSSFIYLPIMQILYVIDRFIF
jgi:protoheme IX farnesyltransferase